jgi:uncharacterized protein YhbP (UPF0306 family)
MLEDLTEYLKLSTMSLGTCGKTGQSHIAPVYFVSDENASLYFYSKPKSQHIRDISDNNSVAVSIYPECFDLEEIRGVQMHGIVEKHNSIQDPKGIWHLYKAKFPFVSKLGVFLADNELFMFRPHWIRIVDNHVRFGYKKEYLIKSNNKE